jgi:hypothetical protein
MQAYEIITPSAGSEIRRMQTLTEEVTGKQVSCHLKPKNPPVGALDLHKYKMHSLLERSRQLAVPDTLLQFSILVSRSIRSFFHSSILLEPFCQSGKLCSHVQHQGYRAACGPRIGVPCLQSQYRPTIRAMFVLSLPSDKSALMLILVTTQAAAKTSMVAQLVLQAGPASIPTRGTHSAFPHPRLLQLPRLAQHLPQPPLTAHP